MGILAIECIEEHRTYTREELLDSYPWFDSDYWTLLKDLYGLIPLGSEKNQIVFGRNLIESLTNHACGTIVGRQRKPIPKKNAQKIQRQMRSGDWNGQNVGEPDSEPD